MRISPEEFERRLEIARSNATREEQAKTVGMTPNSWNVYLVALRKAGYDVGSGERRKKKKKKSGQESFSVPVSGRRGSEVQIVAKGKRRRVQTVIVQASKADTLTVKLSEPVLLAAGAKEGDGFRVWIDRAGRRIELEHVPARSVKSEEEEVDLIDEIVHVIRANGSLHFEAISSWLHARGFEFSESSLREAMRAESDKPGGRLVSMNRGGFFGRSGGTE